MRLYSQTYITKNWLRARQAEAEAKTGAELENKDSFQNKLVEVLFEHFKPAQVSSAQADLTC